MLLFGFILIFVYWRSKNNFRRQLSNKYIHFNNRGPKGYYWHHCNNHNSSAHRGRSGGSYYGGGSSSGGGAGGSW